MMRAHCCSLRPRMHDVVFYFLSCFCYILDVGSEPHRIVIGVLFDPNLMKFGSFADMKLYDSSATLVLTLIICQSPSDVIFGIIKLSAISTIDVGPH
jgi:hypothetical protein